MAIIRLKINLIIIIDESIAEFESRCKYLGSKCEYSKMENPEEELIQDRFVIEIFDDKLRAELLCHKKDDGTVFSLSEVKKHGNL